MFIKTIGQGPDLVMLHGWSMHSAVWHQLKDSLAQLFTLHLVDLPGHGFSEWQDNDFELDSLLNQLAEQLPEKAYWLGWSLGGLISIAFAHRFKQRVNKLSLIAASPCFVKTADWHCAMEADVFKDFANNLTDNQADTLQRFLLLQARGSQHSRDTIRQISEQLAVENPPHPQALKAGLDVLINTDLRQPLAELECPIQMIIGDRDTLIPVELVEHSKHIQSNLQSVVIAKAGHAPFISHSAECQQAIEHFLND